MKTLPPGFRLLGAHVARARLIVLGLWFLLALVRPVQAADSRVVVAFGDSTTAPREGVEVYASQLTRRFSSASPPVRFLNEGVPGDNTRGACARLATDVLALHPDLVVVQFGINDSAVDVWKHPPATASRVSLEQFKKNLRYLVGEIQRNGAKVILMTPNQLRWAPITRERYRLPPYDPGDELSFTRPLAPYAEAVRETAADFKIPLVDVYQAYADWEKAQGVSCAQLMIDGMHPATEGHALVAGALAPLIAELLGLENLRVGRAEGGR